MIKTFTLILILSSNPVKHEYHGPYNTFLQCDYKGEVLARQKSLELKKDVKYICVGNPKAANIEYQRA